MELKPLSKEAIPGALEKAQLYRLLHEPEDAESICLDILTTSPDSQEAMTLLVLARTDQLDVAQPGTLERAQRVLEHLRIEYDRHYYCGLIHERWAKQLLRGGASSAAQAREHLDSAIVEYERAAPLADPENDEAILRHNSCHRLIERYGLG